MKAEPGRQYPGRMKEDAIMKAIRFIVGYANYRIDNISIDPVLDETTRNTAIKRIDKAVRAYETGALTVDEAMKAIMEVNGNE